MTLLRARVFRRMLEYSLDLQNVSFSAVRTVRVLRPLRAINRVPSKLDSYSSQLMQVLYVCAPKVEEQAQVLSVLHCSNVHPSLVVLGPTTTPWFPMLTLNNALFDTSSVTDEPSVNKIPRTVSTLLSFSSEEGLRRLLR